MASRRGTLGVVDTSTPPRRTAANAAGLLLTVPGPTPRLLLALRSGLVPHPHTWSVPAGTLEPGEDPVEGAVREAREELGPLPPFTVCGSVAATVAAGWTFTTVIATTPAAVPVTARGVDAWEIARTRWVTPASGRRLGLHPQLRDGWDRLVSVVARRHAHLALLEA